MAHQDWSAMADTAGEDEGDGFTPLPAGQYDAEVVLAEVGQTKAGDKDKIAARFKVVGGPYAGRILFNDFTLSPESDAALKFFFRQLTALGYPRDFFTSRPDGEKPRQTLELVAEGIVGRACRLQVIIDDTYDVNNPRNKVRGVRPPEGGATPPAAAAPPTASGFPVPSDVPPPPGRTPAAHTASRTWMTPVPDDIPF